MDCYGSAGSSGNRSDQGNRLRAVGSESGHIQWSGTAGNLQTDQAGDDRDHDDGIRNDRILGAGHQSRGLPLFGKTVAHGRSQAAFAQGVGLPESSQASTSIERSGSTAAILRGDCRKGTRHPEGFSIDRKGEGHLLQHFDHRRERDRKGIGSAGDPF